MGSLLTQAVVLSVSDENFGKLVSGKANAQQLFMSGKLKIKGNAMKVRRLSKERGTRC
jgi:putative sterol carrier protein